MPTAAPHPSSSKSCLAVPNGGWTYVVTSARENAVLCYEVTAKKRAIVPVVGDMITTAISSIASAVTLSLLLLAGTIVLWVHSYWAADEIMPQFRGRLSSRRSGQYISFS